MESGGSSFFRSLDGSAWVSAASPLKWRLAAGADHQTGRLEYSNPDHRQEFRLVEVQRGSESIVLRVGARSYVMSAGLTLREPLAPTSRVSLGINSNRFGAVAVSFRRLYPRTNLNANWREERIKLQINNLSEELTVWMRSPTVDRFRAELLFKRTNYIRSSGEMDRAAIEPWGEQNSYHGFLTYDARKWKTALGMRGLEMGILAYGVKADNPFAKVTDLSLNVSAFFISVEYHSVPKVSSSLIELEYLQWEGYGRGHVEFWPFTSGLADLLGMRRYFISATEGELIRLHIALHSRANETWGWGAGLNLFDIKPDAYVQHWKPVYLIFGKADEQWHSLDIYHILLNSIHLNLEYSFVSWSFGYNFTQIIPLKTWRRVRQEPAPDEGPGKLADYGGGFHRLTVAYNFGF